MILEVCVDSVESALAAQEGGAGRVELCADLEHGGTTPSAGMIKAVRDRVSIALHAMIRPRPGDFCYSDLEFDVMKRDVQMAKELRVDGIVVGILSPQGTIDVERTRVVADLARPLSVTFHRAFDECSDLQKAIVDLDGLGIDRVLTCGGKANVLEGLDMLACLVRGVEGSIKIMAGGGMTLENLGEIVTKAGVEEVHVLTAVTTIVPQSIGRSGLFDSPKKVVDVSKVAAVVNVLRDHAGVRHG